MIDKKYSVKTVQNYITIRPLGDRGILGIKSVKEPDNYENNILSIFEPTREARTKGPNKTQKSEFKIPRPSYRS